jgi:hypothetical protein
MVNGLLIRPPLPRFRCNPLLEMPFAQVRAVVYEGIGKHEACGLSRMIADPHSIVRTAFVAFLLCGGTFYAASAVEPTPQYNPSAYPAPAEPDPEAETVLAAPKLDSPTGGITPPGADAAVAGTVPPDVNATDNLNLAMPDMNFRGLLTKLQAPPSADGFSTPVTTTPAYPALGPANLAPGPAADSQARYSTPITTTSSYSTSGPTIAPQAADPIFKAP